MVPTEWLPDGLDLSRARIAGLDGVGLGALMGPMVAAAVILPAGIELPAGLRDSKLLDPHGRQIAALAHWILDNAEVYLEEVSPAEIDRVNIRTAERLSFERLLERARPDFAIADGTHRLRSDTPHRVTPRAEQYAPVAAASIVAKVYRDTLMRALDELFPGYSLARSVGYGARTSAATARLGRTAIHRRTFRIKGLD